RGRPRFRESPPQATPGGAGAAALVGDYGQEPWTHLGAGAEPAEAAPGLDRGFLHRVLRRGSVVQHRHRKSKRRIEHGGKQLFKRPVVTHASNGSTQGPGHLLRREQNWVGPVLETDGNER